MTVYGDYEGVIEDLRWYSDREGTMAHSDNNPPSPLSAHLKKT